MSNKLVGWIGIIVGVLLILISLGADLIGIGTYPGINSAQLVGMAGGLVVLALGVFVLLKKQKPKE
jgi:hypothetical protein